MLVFRGVSIGIYFFVSMGMGPLSPNHLSTEVQLRWHNLMQTWCAWKEVRWHSTATKTSMLFGKLEM